MGRENIVGAAASVSHAHLQEQSQATGPGAAQRALWVVWPAFMAACVLELLVFAVVDPSELQWSGQTLGWSRQAAYTVGFFVFWAVAAGACAFTTLLRMSPADLNACPFTPSDRPEGCPGR